MKGFGNGIEERTRENKRENIILLISLILYFSHILSHSLLPHSYKTPSLIL